MIKVILCESKGHYLSRNKICFKWIYRWKVIRDFPITVYDEKRINVVELKIRKNGLFYDVFNEDAKILHYLFGYKIKDKRVAFPNNALIKVLNTLEEKRLSYSIIGGGTEPVVKNFKNNNYEKYLIKAQNKILLTERVNKIINKMSTFDEVRLDKLLKEFEKLVFDE